MRVSAIGTWKVCAYHPFSLSGRLRVDVWARALSVARALLRASAPLRAVCLFLARVMGTPLTAPSSRAWHSFRVRVHVALCNGDCVGFDACARLVFWR
eukprot:5944945-Pleurochrysis_carterae.AAC.1